MLIVMAGVPGSGTSTIAAAAARRLDCALVSVDPLHAALRIAGVPDPGLAAAVAAATVAREQLRLGHDVIVDAVNDASAARWQWQELAAAERVRILFVEVVVPNPQEHRRRLALRRRAHPGLPEPSRACIEASRAALEQWDGPRLRLAAGLDARANAAAIAAEAYRE